MAKDFEREENCLIAQINADDKTNFEVAQNYGVASFPTLKYFNEGSTYEGRPQTYEGPRTIEGFRKFMNEKCQTDRTEGGKLGDKAGIIEEYEEIVKNFMKSKSNEDRFNVATNAEKEIKSDKGQVYLRVMSKVILEGSGYLEKESKRLTKVLDNDNVNEYKKDNFKAKLNVIGLFKSFKSIQHNEL